MNALRLPQIVLSSAWMRLAALAALAWVFVTASSIPQGWIAEQRLQALRPGRLRDLAEWGLTELAVQPLFWALLVLFVGSGIASTLAIRRPDGGTTRRMRARTSRPEDAPDEVAAAARSRPKA
ncbi:MAG: hypothetical protein HC923_12860 [Myxococcales bacterium]|nr:hypothetical protein [Myxococcales bacterium]